MDSRAIRLTTSAPTSAAGIKGLNWHSSLSGSNMGLRNQRMKR